MHVIAVLLLELATISDAPRSSATGCYASSDASQLAGAPERRLANNGCPYTRTEFLEWYGDAAERRWADALSRRVIGQLTLSGHCASIIKAAILLRLLLITALGPAILFRLLLITAT